MVIKKITIKLDKIEKQFNNKVIFKNSTLFFESGNIYSIIGRNGSGKTTFVQCLSGVYKFTKGKVFLNNKVVNPDSAHYKKNISIAFQHTFLDMMVIPIKALKSYIKYFNKIDKKEILKYFELLGIEKKDYNKKIYQLSGGTKKKLEIIKTILTDVPIMVFDEPFSGIDSDTKNKIIDIIINLKKRNKIIIIVTHSNDIVNISDKVFTICNNKIEEEIMPDEIIFTFDTSIDIDLLEKMIQDKIILEYEEIKTKDQNFKNFNNENLSKENIEKIIKNQPGVPSDLKIGENHIIDLEEGESLEELMKRLGINKKDSFFINFDNSPKETNIKFKVQNKDIAIGKMITFFTENNIYYKNIKIL